jgi:outer membrane receptor protein involved in Fe transport
MTTNRTNYQTSWQLINRVFLIGLLMLPVVLFSQDTTTSDEDESQIFELSPFEVSSTEDVGYLATSSLSGTRINSMLRDLGSSISVITPEFIDDTGARDINELLVYTTSTESAGVAGNFGNTSFTGGGNRPEQDSVRTNPETANRIRGLANAERSVDFFITEFGNDTYNVERVDISRGPNSVLFGVGSPGGVLNTTLKRANFNGNRGKLGLDIGEYDTYRATLDYNFEVFEDRLALRVNYLNEDHRYRQKPTFEKNERVHVAMTGILIKPAPGFLGKNTVRFSYEWVDVETAPPSVIPPTDNLRWWYAPPDNVAEIEATTGVSFPDHYKDGTYQSQAMYDLFGANEPVLNAPDRQPFFSGIGLIFNNAFTDADPLTGFTDPAIADLQAHLGNVRANSGPPAFPWFVSTALTEGGFIPGYTAPTLLDTTMYDFVNQHIYGDWERRLDEFENITFSMEQLFFSGNAGIEIAYNEQNMERFRNFSFTDSRSKDIWIDNNLWLGNGQPNPNAGRPMLVTRHVNVVDPVTIDRRTLRATAFYNLDFTELLDDGVGRWLGRHVFSGIVEGVDRDYTQEEREMGPALGETGIFGTHINRYGGSSGRLHGAFYIGPDLRGVAYDDIRLSGYLRAPKIPEGYGFRGFFLNRQDQEIQNRDFTTRYYLDQLDATRQELDSKAITWQAFLLEDYIVGLIGYREDRVKGFVDEGLSRYPDGPLEGGYIPGSNTIKEEPDLDVTDNTLTWSVVVHYPEKYLPKLPWGMDLSLFYAESENFQPVGFRQNVFLDPVGPPSGVTEEVGFLITLADNKYSLRVNWFDTINSNIAGGGSLASNPVDAAFGHVTRSLSAQNNDLPFDVGATGRTTGLIAAGYTSYEEFHQALINLVPDPLKSAYNPRLVTGDAGNVNFERDPLEGGNPVSVFDFRAKGVEIEFVANPTPNWRIALNIAKQETVRSGVGADLGAYYDEMVQNYKDANLWDTNILEEPAQGSSNITLKSRFLDRHASRLAAFRATDGTINQEQRKWRVNFLTSYKFMDDSGFLKGFTVGGAIRWQDKAAIGYPLLLQTIEGGDVLQVPDLANPFFNDAIWNGDVFVKYERKLTRDVHWSIRLSFRNYLGDTGLIPELRNPDGSLAVVRIPAERRWTISNTFSF